MVKDYGHLLAHDPAYAAKASGSPSSRAIPIEIVGAEWKRIAPLIAMDRGSQRIAFHPPCTLQHGMKLKGRVEEILLAIGPRARCRSPTRTCAAARRAPTRSCSRSSPAAQAQQARRARGRAAGRDRRRRTSAAMTHLASGTARAGPALDRAARRADARRAHGRRRRRADATIGHAARARGEPRYRHFLASRRAGWTTTPTATSTTSPTTRTSTPWSTST